MRHPALVFLGVSTLLAVAPAACPAQRLSGEAKTNDAKPVATLKGFPDWVTSVAFSPDGTLLAAGSYEVVRLWDASQKKDSGELKLKSGFARSLAFSPDGRTLAVGGSQTTVLWNVAQRERVGELKGHRGYVTDVCFSSDGTLLATASEDLTAKVWRFDNRTELRTLTGHEYPVLGVAFSPDGSLIATAAGDETRLTKPGEVKTWSVETGEVVHTFPPHERGATDVTFSPDGTLLVSSSLDEKLNVYDVASGTAKGCFGGHSRPTNCVAFVAGGRLVVSGSGGRFKGKNEVKVWTPDEGEEFGTIDHHEGKITSLAVSPDGRLLATGSYDKSVSVWDMTPILAKAGVTPTGEKLVAAADTKSDPDAARVQGAEASQDKVIRVGIIGLDTSHSVAFTKLLNGEKPGEVLAGCRIVAAYPKGSPDIKSSTERVPGYTEEVQKLGVEIVDSIETLVGMVDCVLLETNDGRPHLEQVLPVLRAKKPVFVDKPIAGSLTDAVAIFEAARHYEVPLFSSSSLRWIEGGHEIRGGSLGTVMGADVYGPCALEATHPDLFWYGIHGVEALFTVMGTGCQSVSRTSTPDFDVAVGTWDGGRIGTFRGIRKGQGGYGGIVFGEKGKRTLERYGGYGPLVEAIAHFFKTGEAPVAEPETLEIYAFMEAADESKRQGGAPVTLESVMAKARSDAAEKLKGRLK